jgi:hypothetical protein
MLVQLSALSNATKEVLENGVLQGALQDYEISQMEDTHQSVNALETAADAMLVVMVILGQETNNTTTYSDSDDDYDSTSKHKSFKNKHCAQLCKYQCFFPKSTFVRLAQLSPILPGALG